ncbi:uncharacterized protein LOC127795906 isoform X2 [Diospyros lotus]|uniref:uncharacterized protein LOC127795906 isoform X2 n=1 Tax=Diospyros lotus TaxID=55363 RepID=UPI002258BF98|nr:uncharacterized protein LOC127795906 isoform X2 [Diospyros lotus]
MEEEGSTFPVVSDGVGDSLIRDLASCKKVTRDKALKQVLKSWLPSQSPDQVSDEDMKKLWKGLFYCVWHADKSAVQLDLINRLSSILLALPLPLSLHYFSVFLLTMRREWSGIDALRLDKFYLLIRRFLHFSFIMLKKNYSWDLEISRRFLATLEEKTFFADDMFLGNGVNYHLASIFLEELSPFLPIRSEAVVVIFEPLVRLMAHCLDKVLLGKVKSNIFDVLLRMGLSLLELKKAGADSPDENVVRLGSIALTLGFSTKFYDLGSSHDCFQANRKVLFSLHEDFLRLEKDLASSGIEISIPDVMVDDEDEVPELIPIASETQVAASEVVSEPTEVAFKDQNASANKPLKKKKSKKASNKSKDEAEELDGVDKEAEKKKKKKKEEEEEEEEEEVELPEIRPVVVENGDVIPANEKISSNGTTSDETINSLFNESVISNLQIQFEKVAARAALDKDDSSSHGSLEITPATTISKKRKRVKNVGGKDNCSLDQTGEGKSEDKSAKKVRFSMKNNLVWKPHGPLPPQSLRLPPSVTPRGSALKKGVPPGPIREMPVVTKKVKQKKKGRKGNKTISPAIRRLRKLRMLSI